MRIKQQALQQRGKRLAVAFVGNDIVAIEIIVDEGIAAATQALVNIGRRLERVEGRIPIIFAPGIQPLQTKRIVECRPRLVIGADGGELATPRLRPSQIFLRMPDRPDRIVIVDRQRRPHRRDDRIVVIQPVGIVECLVCSDAISLLVMRGGQHQLSLRIGGIGDRAGQQVFDSLVYLARLQIIAPAGNQREIEGRVNGHGLVDLRLGLFDSARIEIEDRKIGMRDGILRIKLDRLQEGRLGLAVGIAGGLHIADHVPRRAAAGCHPGCGLQILHGAAIVALETRPVERPRLKRRRLARIERQ
ncbi:hypothetical protein D3C73_969570 [compost metagenome]